MPDFSMWELSYAGVLLPPPARDGIQYTEEPVGNYERNAYGDMIIDHVAQKRTVRVTWNTLNGEEIGLITRTLRNNRSGILRYYDDAVHQIVDMNAYYGAGANRTLRLFRNNPLLQRYTGLTINFIQV